MRGPKLGRTRVARGMRRRSIGESYKHRRYRFGKMNMFFLLGVGPWAGGYGDNRKREEDHDEEHNTNEGLFVQFFLLGK